MVWRRMNFPTDEKNDQRIKNMNSKMISHAEGLVDKNKILNYFATTRTSRNQTGLKKLLQRMDEPNG